MRLGETNCVWFGKAEAHPQLVESYTNSLFFLEKTVFPVRQKGGSPLLLPTSMLQSPRCLVWICNLDSRHLTLFDFKNAIAAGKPNLKNKFAPQMWAARPHLGSIFVKLLHRKIFILPAAHHSKPWFLDKPIAYGSAKLGYIPSWSSHTQIACSS